MLKLTKSHNKYLFVLTSAILVLSLFLAIRQLFCWKTYKSDIEFSIKYPSSLKLNDWTIGGVKNEVSSFPEYVEGIFSLTDKLPNASSPENLYLYVVRTPKAYLDSNDIEVLGSESLSELRKLKVSPSESTTLIDGRKAISITYYYSDSRSENCEYWISSRNYIYNIFSTIHLNGNILHDLYYKLLLKTIVSSARIQD